MASGLAIPTRSRVIVRGRDQQRCSMCVMRATNWHHRRSRLTRDEHTHCPCNGVTLCGTGNSLDHGWVHGNPFAARAKGLIILRSDPRPPGEVPVYMEQHDGWVLLGCNGEVTPTDQPQEE